LARGARWIRRAAIAHGTHSVAAVVLVALVFAGSAGTLNAAQLVRGDRQFIDSTVLRAMRSAGLPGVMISVSGPRGTYQRAYGIANLANRAPMRTGLHLRIANVTESFTATAILQQVQRGRLSLSDKLARWVKGIPSGNRITVAQLLANRSGMYDFTQDPKFARALAANPTRPFQPSDAVAIIRRHKPLFAPGARALDTASNYVLLGIILQRVTGRSVESVLTRDVIARAGLRNTTFPRTAALPAPSAHGYSAAARNRLRDYTRVNPKVAWTAGAMISTLGDLQKWAKVLATGALLSAKLQAQRLPFASTSGGGANLGYGLGITQIDDWLGSDGSMLGFSAGTFYEPRTRTQITIAANRSSSAAPPTRAIFTVLAGRLSPIAPVAVTPPSVSGTPRAGQTLSAAPGSWTGTRPISFTYQWQRCDAAGGACQDLPGQTRAAYALGNGEVGARLRVLVSAANRAGSASAPSALTDVVGLSRDPVVVAVGDIACTPGDTANACQQRQTATLAAAQSPDHVFVLGDNQYESGLLSEYRGAGAYDATWGVFNPIVHPVPGNHEYTQSSTAQGYFDYFGVTATAPSGGYSFNAGTWHIIALNSNCSDAGCQALEKGTSSSAQNAWLAQDLAATSSACVLAYWHHPLFSSGQVGSSPGVGPLWTALYQARADLVLNGHDHLYERYAPQNPTATATSSGIREIVVGTGGKSLDIPGINPGVPNLEVSDLQDFGVLVLTLHPRSYDWAFKSTSSGRVIDSGTTACHGRG
jgi:D-alanyl-D-alanine carboxypeptidase